jgi:4-hydroxybenzoate polyprenyltransferase
MTVVSRGMSNASDALSRPLVVGLEGTLVRSDLLIETALCELSRNPLSLIDLCMTLMQGKAALKRRLAESAALDPSALPYDEAVLARIRKAKSEGRPIYLASASNQRLVEAVADHVGLFSASFASVEMDNLPTESQTRRFEIEFGERGYDYIGKDAADLQVWAKAAQAIAIRAPAAVTRHLAQQGIEVEHLPAEPPTWRTWVKLFRVHQYVKNALVFVPLILAHQFSLDLIARAILAALAFCLCASSVYVLNDLVDLQADRQHPTKRHRPLASGAIPLLYGILAVPLLFMASTLIATFVSFMFLAIVLGYFVLTTAYSFLLKRKMLLDVIALATLYLIRLVAGAVAVQVAFSEWLLAFSMFFFMALALIKRYVELAVCADLDLPELKNRNYKRGDLDVVGALAAAAGLNAVTVFALFISSDNVHFLYRRPLLLWLICPVLLYWISRALMMAHRRLMDDDPIIFALRDRNSIVAGAIIALIFIAAS